MYSHRTMTGDHGRMSLLAPAQAFEVCARNDVSNSLRFRVQNFRGEFSTGDHPFDCPLCDLAYSRGFGGGDEVIGHVSNIRQGRRRVKGWRETRPRGEGGYLRGCVHFSGGQSEIIICLSLVNVTQPKPEQNPSTQARPMTYTPKGCAPRMSRFFCKKTRPGGGGLEVWATASVSGKSHTPANNFEPTLALVQCTRCWQAVTIHRHGMAYQADTSTQGLCHATL